MKQGFAHPSDLDGQETRVKTTSAPPCLLDVFFKNYAILHPFQGAICNGDSISRSSTVYIQLRPDILTRLLVVARLMVREKHDPPLPSG